MRELPLVINYLALVISYLAAGAALVWLLYIIGTYYV
jgi:hypothetical protein